MDGTTKEKGKTKREYPQKGYQYPIRVAPDLWAKFRLMVKNYSSVLSPSNAINMLIEEAVNKYALPGFIQKAAPEWEQLKREEEKHGSIIPDSSEIVGPLKQPRQTPAASKPKNPLKP